MRWVGAFWREESAKEGFKIFFFFREIIDLVNKRKKKKSMLWYRLGYKAEA